MELERHGRPLDSQEPGALLCDEQSASGKRAKRNAEDPCTNEGPCTNRRSIPADAPQETRGTRAQQSEYHIPLVLQRLMGMNVFQIFFTLLLFFTLFFEK